MKLSTPRWWYQRGGQPAPVMRALLRPAAWLWAWSTARRIARGEPFDPGVPVICVGNLTVGGAGKTPVVREILSRLRARGVAASGLSRGHGGSMVGPVRVDPHDHTAGEVGDEPLMLSADGPFWIARDRVEGALAAADAGAKVIVMDDGHQNPTLLKALSLVVVDGETRGGEWPFGDGRVVPSGPMREPLAAGLARADAVVVMLPDDLAAADPDLLALFGRLPVLIARLRPAAACPPGPQLGFAGVGKPWKVERALKAAGCELVDFAPYPDHAEYSENDLKFLASRAAVFGAGLVTTEKDWARLPRSGAPRCSPGPSAPASRTRRRWTPCWRRRWTDRLQPNERSRPDRRLRRRPVRPETRRYGGAARHDPGRDAGRQAVVPGWPRREREDRHQSQHRLRKLHDPIRRRDRPGVLPDRRERQYERDSVYVMGIEDRKYLPTAYGEKIGKASVTGYCIKFKAMKDIDVPTLEAAIRDGLEATGKS